MFTKIASIPSKIKTQIAEYRTKRTASAVVRRIQMYTIQESQSSPRCRIDSTNTTS